MKRIFSLAIALTLVFSTQAQDRMTPELLWDIGRVSGGTVSPNGEQVLYGVTYYNLDSNSGNRDLYLVPVSGGTPEKITDTEKSEGNEVWRPDGKKIGYLASTDNGRQLFEINPDGTGKRQVTDIDGGIDNFAYAPDQAHVYFTRKVKMDETVHDRYPDLPQANARIIDNLMYRHWDTWDDHKNNHLFVADYADGEVSNMRDIMEGEPFDTPLEPFGGSSELAWSPDGKKVAYTSKKLQGRAYTLSTNSDIYLYDLESGETTNVSENMPGYDMEPVFSPSGDYMVWQSMQRAGFESDRNRLFIYDFTKDERYEVTTELDRDALHPVWSPDESYIYFLSGEEATYQVFELDLESREVTQLTEGAHNYRSISLADENTLVATRQDMNHPTELYTIDIENRVEQQLTFTNRELYENINTGNIEERWIETTDGKQMLTWVIYPPDFDPDKEYPTLLYCQGGPQAAVSQFFSFRWNFQLMAANDYIIVAPNRRGLPSFGREWNDQISGDWGGQAMQDYLSAIDEMAKEDYVDNDRLGAIGASFGGYSTYWLAGNHDDRFKSFIAHCGVFNLESWYLSTEEMWFANWDLGGPYWEDGLQEDYDAFSPHRFLENWDTPILVIHGQKDFRVPVEQGIQAFNGARLQGLQSRFLYFPEEGHWIQSPQNGVLWHREFFRWLDETLK